jgi:N-acyl-D-aspartate/D-glutamate deacylase
MIRAATCIATLLAVPLLAQAPAPTTYDIVIAGGRVMDPASATDMIANVGVAKGRVAAISRQRLAGRLTIDARGLVVAPGFIDILARPTVHRDGQRFKVTDGVTAVLGMHGGPALIPAWYEARQKAGSLHHFGTTVGHAGSVTGGPADAGLRETAGVTDRYKAANDEQLAEMIRVGEQALRDGAVGVGFGLEYVPGSSRLETFELFRLAAKHGVPCHLHVRFSDPIPPGTNFEALEEVIAAMALSGAAAQVVHINSTGGTWTMRTSLELLDLARARGLDLAADVYPYTAWSTGLSSARFDPGFLENFRIRYEDIELVTTGERLTEETFKKYRAQGGVNVIAHAMPEEELVLALKHPQVMIGSDGVIENGRGHPRGAGTFARLLGRYVRDQRVLTLMQALGKMTIMPARRLEKAVPAMRRKGRLSVGADADITVFDPAAVRDRATFQNPAQASEGIRHVLVAGVPVVVDGVVREGVAPGQPIRRPLGARTGTGPGAEAR